jgi:hypothetical protein
MRFTRRLVSGGPDEAGGWAHGGEQAAWWLGGVGAWPVGWGLGPWLAARFRLLSSEDASDQNCGRRTGDLLFDAFSVASASTTEEIARMGRPTNFVNHFPSLGFHVFLLRFCYKSLFRDSNFFSYFKIMFRFRKIVHI